MSGSGTTRWISAVLLGGAALSLLPAATRPAAAHSVKHSALMGRYVGTFRSDGGASTGDFELTINIDRTSGNARTLLGRGRFGKQWQQLMGSYSTTAQGEAFACLLHRGTHNLVVSLNLSFSPGAKSGIGDYLVTRDRVLLEHGTVSVERP